MDKTIEHFDTRITDQWGVVWDETETVRDFIQNFVDANRVKDIKIQIEGKTVKISAPAEFDHKQLVYFYSDKANNPDTIGQYGEGFKASLLNAMRNWNCTVEMYVGDKKLSFYFKALEIGESDNRVIMCEISNAEPVTGTLLVVKNCSSRLLTEFKFGLKHFYYRGNPLFGDCIIDDRYDDIQVYKSTEENCGYLFYGKLIRAKLNLPLVIVCSKKYKRIDEKIKFDRDRKAFTQEVKESLIKYIFNTLKYVVLDELLLHVKDFWIKGDNDLAIIAETRHIRWNQEIPINKIFPENYYAKESYPHYSDSNSFLLSPLIKEITDGYRVSKYNCCPRYMAKFGMKTPDYIARQRMIERQKNITDLYSRDLTLLEKQGIDLLSDFIRKLSADLYNCYKNAVYTIGENDEVIGELKEKRNYRDQHIFLNKVFFGFSFNDALAILLHEWSHLYGSDGSRSFSDALTGFISLILKKEKVLEELKSYVDKWKEISEKIQDERKDASINTSLDDLFSALSKEKLTEILASIPQEECLKLLKKNGVV